MLQRMAFFVLVALVGAVGSVEASSTARADFDGSGRIDSADYALFYDAYGTMVGQDVFHPKFDLDADGAVGISDWMLFVDEWGKTTSAADTETDDILAARSDFDGTGLVDGLDYLLLITALKADFNLLFDLNADESVDMLDRDLFVEDWGKTVPKDLIPLCDRTPEVRDEILRLLGAGNTCDSVTRTALLALKDTLHLQDSGITALKVDDFAGLDSIRVLLLDNNALTTIEPHAFDSLKTIRRMYLRDNAITSIADSVFVNLDSLRTVDVTGNPGEPFPLRFSIKRLDARPASMARPAEIAIQVPFKVPKPFGLLFTARVENIGHGLYKKLTIPVRDTSVVFTFDTFETEESGWGYRGSDSNDPPYLLSIREHNLSSALRYGQNSYGGTYYGTYTKGGRGFYGFKAVTDSLCIYSEDCNSVIYRRTYAGGGSVPRGSGGGGGGTTTTPGTSNPGSGGTTTTPGTGNPGSGGTTTTPGTGNPGSGGRVTLRVAPNPIYETAQPANNEFGAQIAVEYELTFSPPHSEELSVEIEFGKAGDTAVFGTHYRVQEQYDSTYGFFVPPNTRSHLFETTPSKYDFKVINKTGVQSDVSFTVKATVTTAGGDAPGTVVATSEQRVRIRDFSKTPDIPPEPDNTFGGVGDPFPTSPISFSSLSLAEGSKTDVTFTLASYLTDSEDLYNFSFLPDPNDSRFADYIALSDASGRGLAALAFEKGETSKVISMLASHDLDRRNERIPFVIQVIYDDFKGVHATVELEFANPSQSTDYVSNVVITNGGSGYVTAPTLYANTSGFVSKTPGHGSWEAAFVARGNLTGDTVTSFTILNNISIKTSNHHLFFAGGGPRGFALYADQHHVTIRDTWPTSPADAFDVSISPGSIEEGETVSLLIEIHFAATPIADSVPIVFKTASSGEGTSYTALSENVVLFSNAQTRKHSRSFFKEVEFTSLSDDRFEENEKIWFELRHADTNALFERVSIDVLQPSESYFLTLSPKDSLEIKDPSTRRSVSVRLPARPDEAVTVTIPGDDPDFTISESELVFTPSNWSRSQSVTFTISPSFKYSSWSFGFAVSSDDRRFNGLFVPYVVYGQIPDQPSTITFTSNTNENFRNSVNRFSDNHWGDYAGLTSVTRQSGSDRHLKGFRYFLETIRGIRIPIEKFEEYAHTACVFFGTDAVTGTGSLSSPVKGTWDAAEGYWKLSEEVIITDLEPEHTSNRFQIRIRKNCN